MQVGKQSLEFARPPRIIASHAIVGKKEGDGPLGAFFDEIVEDPYLDEESWEEAEIKLQKQTLQSLLIKSKTDASMVRYAFAGDLLGQTIASSFGLETFQIPLFGLYGACSTSGEGLMLGAMTVAAGYADRVVAVTSSHFCGAEKQFRFPLGYGNQRPLSSTWTVTGGGAFLIGSQEADQEQTDGAKVQITGVTTGKVVDFGIKDSMNMGACMAPAAADLIGANFRDFQRGPEDYDALVTGDLGGVGSAILYDLLKEEGWNVRDVHLDCGVEMFGVNEKLLPPGEAVEPGRATAFFGGLELAETDCSIGDGDVHCGGSGCGCSASVLACYVLPKLRSGEWKRVLYVPTGALLSPTSYNEGLPVPGIAQGIVLEQGRG